MYHIRDNAIFYEGRRVHRADVESFEQLSQQWGVDRQRVYAFWRERKQIDRASFRLLNAIYAVDKSRVHYNVGIVSKADPNTFQALDPGYFCSKHGGETWRTGGYGCDSQSVWWWNLRIHGADPKTFVSMRNGFGYDVNHVYCEHRRIKGANPRTWVPGPEWYSADTRHGFCYAKAIKGLDVEWMSAVYGALDCVRDRERYYLGLHPIPKAEVVERLRRQINRLEARIQIIEEDRDDCPDPRWKDLVRVKRSADAL